jgi:hypothetical protein
MQQLEDADAITSWQLPILVTLLFQLQQDVSFCCHMKCNHVPSKKLLVESLSCVPLELCKSRANQVPSISSSSTCLLHAYQQQQHVCLSSIVLTSAQCHYSSSTVRSYNSEPEWIPRDHGILERKGIPSFHPPQAEPPAFLCAGTTGCWPRNYCQS